MTGDQIERLVKSALRRGRREGMLLTDIDRAAKVLIDEMKEEPSPPSDQKQWFVVYQGMNLERTFKAFGEDQDQAKDFAEQTQWGFIAAIYDFPAAIWKAKRGTNYFRWRQAS